MEANKDSIIRCLDSSLKLLMVFWIMSILILAAIDNIN